MSRNFNDWLVIVIVAIIALIILSILFGFGNAWAIFNISKYPILIITGIIGLLFGIKRKYWSKLFWLVSLCFILKSLR